MKTKKTQQKVRYAVIGLGHIAQIAVLPAFKHSKGSELACLISEDSTKLKELSKMYKVPKENCFKLEDFPACLKAARVDFLYLATPNDTHCEFVLKALDQGVHVLCEKPPFNSIIIG